MQGPILLYDNARPHILQTTALKLSELTEIPNYLPYLPDPFLTYLLLCRKNILNTNEIHNVIMDFMAVKYVFFLTVLTPPAEVCSSRYKLF